MGRKVLLVITTVTRGLILQLALLAVSVSGIGQRGSSPELQSLLADARTAQSSGNFAVAAADYERAVQLQPAVPQLWANLGLMQHESGNYSEAIASFRQAARLNPTLYVPNLFLGIDYAQTGKAQAAVPFLINAERINKADPQAPLALGRVYVVSGNLPAAIHELELATELDPKLSPGWFTLGIAHLQQVEKEAQEISARGKDSPYSGALYAASLQKQGRFAEAAALYKSLLNSHPQPPCLSAELGFSLFRDHNETGAREAFAAENVQHPECMLASLGEVRLAVEDGDHARAAALLQDLWGHDHGFVEANAPLLLDSSSSTGTPAISYFLASSEASRLSPDLHDALLIALGSSDTTAPPTPPEYGAATHSEDAHASNYANASLAYRSGYYRECARLLAPGLSHLTAPQLDLLAACAHFTGDERLVERASGAMHRLNPQSLEALYWSVQANERLALASLARFQQLDSSSATSHVLLGDIYHQLDRNDDAQSEYLKALSIAPGDPAALLGAATAYLSNNNIPAAQQAAQSALALHPDDPDMNLIMAEVELGRHNYAEAEPFLEKALHTKPQMQPRVHALLGKVYAETDRPQLAIKELQLGVSSDEDGSIQYLLARLYRKLGDTRDAQLALDRMKTIKDGRRERGYKLVEDPELSSIESLSGQPAAP